MSRCTSPQIIFYSFFSPNYFLFFLLTLSIPLSRKKEKKKKIIPKMKRKKETMNQHNFPFTRNGRQTTNCPIHWDTINILLYPNSFSWPANISARVLNVGSPNRRSPSCTHLLIWVNIPTLQRIPASICVISQAFISHVSVLGPT